MMEECLDHQDHTRQEAFESPLKKKSKGPFINDVTQVGEGVMHFGDTLKV